MEEDKKRLKLADIRRITPNPLGKEVEFEPDPEGENIDQIANFLVRAFGFNKADKARKHLNADPKHSSAHEEMKDATDRNNWIFLHGRWRLSPNKSKSNKSDSQKKSPDNRKDDDEPLEFA